MNRLFATIKLTLFLIGSTVALPCWLGESLALSQQETAGSIEERFLSNVRQLTFEGSRAGEGYFNADGNLMVFQSERRADNPFFQIYLLDFETGEIEPISPGHGKTTCAWIHPDNNHVLFSSTHDDPEAREKQRAEIEFRESGQTRRYAWDYDPYFNIYVFDRTAKTYRQLTDTVGYDAEGSFSPDGSLIAFASNRRGYSEELPPDLQRRFDLDPSILMDIYLMNADGSNVRRLTDHVGYDGGPFFSPDGKRICWRRFSADGLRAEILTMNIDGSDQRQLTRMNVLSWAPFYHPSGKYLIFTTNKHGFNNFELYLVAADGKSMPVRVTDTEGFDGLASFSPDGNQLTWTSGRNSKKESQIYLADWNHEAALAALIDSGVSDITASQVQSDNLQSNSQPTHTTTGDEDVTAVLDLIDSLPAELRDKLADTRMAADLLALEPAAAKDGIEAVLATSPQFSADDVARHVEYLCRPELEGRLVGTEGERKATAYVAGYFAGLGLLPDGDDGSWFQTFEFPAGAELGADNRLELTRADGTRRGLEIDQDWRPITFSASLEIEPTEIVFAGYGIIAPEQADQPAYSSYLDLDVQDKWVMVFRFTPENVTPQRRQYLEFHGGLRKKAFYARQQGAKGIIFVSGPASQVREQLVPLQRDFTTSGFSLAAVSISDQIATQWLAEAEKEIGEVQSQLDEGGDGGGFAIPNVLLAGNLEINNIIGTGRNVIARLQASSTPASSAVLVGAHVDHLGRGETGTSMATDSEAGQIHFGADDNASGVAGVLEIAEYLKRQQEQGQLNLRHDIIFAIWSGEELGLHGSKHYAKSVATTTAADDPPTTQRSSRQFVLTVGDQGDYLVNGEPANEQEISGSFGYLGTNHPEFVVEIRRSSQTPPAAIDRLLDLAEKNGVRKINLIDIESNSSEAQVLIAALNLDMIGRLRDKLVLQGTGSSDYWASAIESRNAVIGLPLALSSDTNIPTDASSFYAVGVPILSAFTGSHPDYHTPRDTPDKLNYPDAARVARLMGLITRGLAISDEKPNYIRQEIQAQRPARAGMRAYLGTSPSYGEDIVGVLLYDVTAGSPADKAGVKAQDIIVGLAGSTIEDIYDYTTALDQIKIGEETEIIVQRDGERFTLKITPESRQ